MKATQGQYSARTSLVASLGILTVLICKAEHAEDQMRLSPRGIKGRSMEKWDKLRDVGEVEVDAARDLGHRGSPVVLEASQIARYRAVRAERVARAGNCIRQRGLQCGRWIESAAEIVARIEEGGPQEEALFQVRSIGDMVLDVCRPAHRWLSRTEAGIPAYAVWVRAGRCTGRQPHVYCVAVRLVIVKLTATIARLCGPK